MKETFSALLERYPGCVVADFRLTSGVGVSLGPSTPEELDTLDRSLANSVREARELTFEDVRALFG